MEKVIIKNCVKCESVVVTEYPRWSDYGCLVNAVEIVYEEDGEYKKIILVTEDVEDIKSYDYEIETWGDIVKYKNYLKQENSKEMIKYHFRVWLNINSNKYERIKVRVVKGRKYPKGLEFIADKATKYEIPGTYGKGTIYYLDGNDLDGNRIHIDARNIEFVEII